jgi:hypothetical protein
MLLKMPPYWYARQDLDLSQAAKKKKYCDKGIADKAKFALY